MSQPSVAARAARIAACAGAVLVLTTDLIGGSRSFVMLPFVLWGLLPYALLAAAGRVFPDAWCAAVAGAAMLAAEAGVRASVFLYPRGSTAAIALVFSPILVALAALPGAAAGWVLGRAWRSGAAVLRAAAAVAVLAALGLTVLGLARPELFPTTVLRRRATVSRIGEPRVAFGSNAFEKVLVSDRPAWYVAGAFDDGPGEAVAVVVGHGVDFLDPGDFHWRGHARLSSPIWDWFSTLARLNGRLVIVQTGGGYSKVEVRELDGSLLWSYRPDPKLPPTALRPADLDGDGEIEFYASDHSATVRLDGAGRVVWSRPTRMATLVGVAPRNAAFPAWVVANEYAGSVRVWDENGALLAERPVNANDSPYGVVDWQEKRTLLLGGKSARLQDLDGKTVFEIPLGEFSLSQALAVRLAPGARPHLAIAAWAPRDLKRARLLLVSPEREIVYDEILEKPVRLLAARRADGSDTLLVGGDGLRALRPR